MAFTINDMQDLIRLLAEHPEWRSELRPLILGDDVLQLPATLNRLAEAQEATQATLVQLTARIDQLTSQVTDLVMVTSRLERRVDVLSGWYTEAKFERRAGAYFGKWLRRARPVTAIELDLESGVDDGRITEEEFDQLRVLDLMVRGNDKRAPGAPDTLLAVEVSLNVRTSDVERALVRARILEKLGYRALPAVAGAGIDGYASAAAERDGVIASVIPILE
jgi:hypothetical protein